MAALLDTWDMAKKQKSNEQSPTGFNHDPVRVLVAWSPSATGSEAIASAAWLSRTTHVQVRCISTLLRPWPSPSMSKLGSKYKKWFKKEAAACETAVTKALRHAEIERSSWSEEVSVLADGSNDASLISSEAQRYDADVIVLGSSATAPKGRLLAGSTADALLHSSPLPVMLVPRSPRLAKRGVTRVNFALVGDDFDAAALNRATELAEAWGAPLRILALSPDGIGEPPVSESFELPNDLRLEWREQTLAALDRHRDQVLRSHPNVAVTTDIGSGAGWSGAIDSLKWKKGDLLCLGSTPMGALQRVFIGSQASEILPHISVPVLMIPAGG